MSRSVPYTTSSTPSVPAQARVSRPLVLVIDPDESARSVLEVGLARDGFDVWSAASGSAGLKLLKGKAPDVIVLESDLGGEDGFSFVAQVRGDERLAKVPVLLLARPGDQNVEAMADVVGVDDYLQKPAFARDVAAMVRVELARREGRGLLRFDAATLPPAQLLRALLSCPRSGRLVLVDQRAEVRFRAGRVIDARFDGKGGNLDALIRALALTNGRYALALEPVDGFAELQCSLRELVNLVMPRLQRWSRVVARSLPLDARLCVDFSRLSVALKAMPDEINRVVQLFDGFRTVEDVLLDSAFDETLTLEVATRLYLMGVLTPARGEPQEILLLKPMPKLFEPRAAEAEELMQQLFDGTLDIRAAEGPAEEPDWYPAVAQGTGLEVSEPDGGWSTAPVPSALALELAPELARQLEAFHTPMQVEAKEPQPEVKVARDFAAGAVAPAQTLEAALAGAVEAPALDLRDRQARIETPWMTPVVQPDTLHVSQLSPAPTPPPSVLVAKEEAAAAAGFDLAASARTVTPVLVPAMAEVGTPAQLRIPTPVATPAVKVEAEAAFFGTPAETEAAEADETLAAIRAPRRVWPFLVGSLMLLAGIALFEALRSPEEAPLVAAVAPAAVTPEQLPDIEPPEFYELEAVAPAVIDVSENLVEAKRLYEAGQYRRAISVLEQVVVDDPRSVNGWLLLGLAKYDAVDSAGALAAAGKVLALEPQNGRVQLLLATLHFDANEKELGRAALQRYLELEPTGDHVDEAKALLAR